MWPAYTIVQTISPTLMKLDENRLPKGPEHWITHSTDPKSVAAAHQACSVGRWIFLGQCCLREPVIPCPSDWRWYRSDNSWPPKWTNLPQVEDACYELVRYGCKTTCSLQMRKSALSLYPIVQLWWRWSIASIWTDDHVFTVSSIIYNDLRLLLQR